jgi:enterochelin esterase-like enzyme
MPGSHVVFQVSAAPLIGAPLSGRLLIFMKRGTGDKQMDVSDPSEDVWVAAQEVRELAPGGTVKVDADSSAYPKPLSQMPAGEYEAQALLDVNHSYNYTGRDPGDWTSPVTTVENWNPSTDVAPKLELDRRPDKDWKKVVALMAASFNLKLAGARKEEFVSQALSRFHQRRVTMRAWVILPPGYSRSSKESYPTAYWTHGFGGGMDSALGFGAFVYDKMKIGQLPPMIWVMLDESIPQGTHEFADSENNGPWGTALITEFVPYLEKKYRMDARPSGRLLTGHSSGGWAALQLQVNYPSLFGGAWAVSPDSVDFHDFNGIDLYAPNANFYRMANGDQFPLAREKGKVVGTMEQFARTEAVLGTYGGQLSSFEWVFSPKSKEGPPQLMFDRETGAIDTEVINHWREHYDLSHLIQANWTDRGADLKGKIHVTVGTADTYYLEGSVRLLDAALARLGGDGHFNYAADRDHFNVMDLGGDSTGLWNKISEEMYAVARPESGWGSKK